MSPKYKEAWRYWAVMCQVHEKSLSQTAVFDKDLESNSRMGDMIKPFNCVHYDSLCS